MEISRGSQSPDLSKEARPSRKRLPSWWHRRMADSWPPCQILPARPEKKRRPRTLQLSRIDGVKAREIWASLNSGPCEPAGVRSGEMEREGIIARLQ